MKKLISLIVVLGAIGGGTYWYLKYGTPEVKPQVTESAITRGSIVESVQATGTLDALRTVQIGTQVSGVVQQLYVDYNDIVKKDQLLAELDPSILQTQVAVQEANLLRSKVDLEQKNITLENDKRKLERQQELFSKNLVTKEQLETAQLSVKMDEASINSSKASLVQTQANLDTANLNLGYTKIRAPIDGVITNRAADRGQTVNATNSAPTLYTMATDLTTMKLTASIDEAEVSKVRKGQPVTFRVDSYAGSTFRGTVNQVRLNAKNSQNVVTYETVIDVQNSDLRLKPGMTATLTIEVQRVDDTMKIPAAALRFRPTAEMFELLKQPVPPEAQAGAGRGAGGMGGGRGGRTGADAGAMTTPGATAAPGATTPAAGKDAAAKGATAPAAAKDAAPSMTGGQSGRQRGQSTDAGQQASAGMGGDTRGGGRGGNSSFGSGGGRGQGGGGTRGGFSMTPEQQKQIDAIRANTKLTPEEQRAEMAKIFGSMGGGRGGQSGGQGGRSGGGRQNGQTSAGPGIADRGATNIDELLPPVVRRETPNQRVWIFVKDAAGNGQLKPINAIRTGITDGQTTEMVTGELKEGDKVVTNFIIPGATKTGAPQQQQQGNPFQQQGGRGGPGGGGGRGGF